MPASATATAVQWIAGQEPGRWFWGHQVPGPSHITQPVLSRMCKDAPFGLWRVARGLYWQGFPEGHEFHGMAPCFETGALIYAGPGAGLADWNALDRMGWTTQCDPKSSVAVVGRRLNPIHPTVRFYTSKNRRREHLSWAEVTVLEALTMLPYTEEPWDECLDTLERGISAQKLKWNSPINPDALLWAAETEAADIEEAAQDISKVLGSRF